MFPKVLPTFPAKPPYGRWKIPRKLCMAWGMAAKAGRISWGCNERKAGDWFDVRAIVLGCEHYQVL